MAVGIVVAAPLAAGTEAAVPLTAMVTDTVALELMEQAVGIVAVEQTVEVLPVEQTVEVLPVERTEVMLLLVERIVVMLFPPVVKHTETKVVLEAAAQTAMSVEHTKATLTAIKHIEVAVVLQMPTQLVVKPAVNITEQFAIMCIITQSRPVEERIGLADLPKVAVVGPYSVKVTLLTYC